MHALLSAALLTAALSAAAMALAGTWLASQFIGYARLWLVCGGLVIAALELAWPVRLPELKEPTRSLGAIALVLAAVRTTRGDDVQIASLFLVQGDVKETPRLSLYLSLGASIAITAVGATADPFVVLAPMLPLGLVGLWGARNGVYPARGGVALRPQSANAQNLGSDPQERS